MFFGEKLKELRLEKAKMGLRNFANEIGMTPKELSDIERGHAKYPDDVQWIWKIIYALYIQSDMSEQNELINLWKKPFVMQNVKEGSKGVPVLSSDKDGNLLSEDKMIKLADYVNTLYSDAKDNNEKNDGTKRKDI